jgi:uncharacterized membrane protein YhaH (DUF805 family)
MNAFFLSITYNMRRLFDFRGRETQILFWPYAGFIFGLGTVVTTGLIMIPIMEMAANMMQQIAVAAQQGGGAEPAFLKSPELLIPDFGGLVLPTVAVNLVMIALLAAAIARRLHDKDRSGFWGLPPLPSMLIGFALMPRTLAGMYSNAEPDPLVALAMLNSFLTYGLLILLVVMLVGKGSEGPNRFGGALPAAA